MKCRYCKAEIPDGELYCSKCGNEVCIVPDYNPLDDMLTAQIKVGMTTSDVRGTSKRRDTDSGRYRDTASGRNRNQDTAGRSRAEREKRRKQAEKKKAVLKKKRRRLLMILAGILAVIVILCVVIYQNSYNGVMNKGNKAYKHQEYEEAATYYKKAIGKNEKKADAYIGLSEVYVAQKKIDEAENLFLSTIEKQPGNADIYEACIGFYLDTKQNTEIPLLLEEASERVIEKLAEYIIDGPEYSLDDSEVYDDVQQLTLTSDEAEIYYTIDGTDPTLQSTKHTKEGILLQEGENVIKAIAVNKKGVPSAVVEKTYVVEFPVEDAPAVSPSTGQYEKAMKIEVKVPDGYEAYYTMDGENPTTASKKYTGPIDMPEGETLFKVVLVNSKGRMSGITTRNYLREIPEE